MAETLSINCTGSTAVATMDWGTPEPSSFRRRAIPGRVDSPNRTLNINDTRACGGDGWATIMAGDARYWLTPDEHGHIKSTLEHEGHRWIARSASVLAGTSGWAVEKNSQNRREAP